MQPRGDTAERSTNSLTWRRPTMQHETRHAWAASLEEIAKALQAYGELRRCRDGQCVKVLPVGHDNAVDARAQHYVRGVGERRVSSDASPTDRSRTRARRVIHAPDANVCADSGSAKDAAPSRRRMRRASDAAVQAGTDPAPEARAPGCTPGRMQASVTTRHSSSSTMIAATEDCTTQ